MVEARKFRQAGPPQAFLHVPIAPDLEAAIGFKGEGAFLAHHHGHVAALDGFGNPQLCQGRLLVGIVVVDRKGRADEAVGVDLIDDAGLARIDVEELVGGFHALGLDRDRRPQFVVCEGVGVVLGGFREVVGVHVAEAADLGLGMGGDLLAVVAADGADDADGEDAEFAIGRGGAGTREAEGAEADAGGRRGAGGDRSSTGKIRPVLAKLPLLA